MMDNASQFVCKGFSDFAHTWNFKHVHSSPHCPQSNGLVEQAIRSAKYLLKKCYCDTTDIQASSNLPHDGLPSPDRPEPSSLWVRPLYHRSSPPRWKMPFCAIDPKPKLFMIGILTGSYLWQQGRQSGCRIPVGLTRQRYWGAPHVNLTTTLWPHGVALVWESYLHHIPEPAPVKQEDSLLTPSQDTAAIAEPSLSTSLVHTTVCPEGSMNSKPCISCSGRVRHPTQHYQDCIVV